MNGSKYIKGLREQVGDSLLLLPGVAGVILNESNEILLQEKNREVREGGGRCMEVKVAEILRPSSPNLSAPP
jgi:hypothetical protein